MCDGSCEYRTETTRTQVDYMEYAMSVFELLLARAEVDGDFLKESSSVVGRVLEQTDTVMTSLVRTVNKINPQ